MLKKLNTEHELLLRQHYKNEIQRIFCNMFDNLDESAQHEILRTFSTSDKKKLYKYLKNNAVVEHDKFKALVYKSYITQSKKQQQQLLVCHVVVIVHVRIIILHDEIKLMRTSANA